MAAWSLVILNFLNSIVLLGLIIGFVAYIFLSIQRGNTQNRLVYILSITVLSVSLICQFFLLIANSLNDFSYPQFLAQYTAYFFSTISQFMIEVVMMFLFLFMGLSKKLGDDIVGESRLKVIRIVLIVYGIIAAVFNALLFIIVAFVGVENPEASTTTGFFVVVFLFSGVKYLVTIGSVIITLTLLYMSAKTWYNPSFDGTESEESSADAKNEYEQYIGFVIVILIYVIFHLIFVLGFTGKSPIVYRFFLALLGDLSRVGLFGTFLVIMFFNLFSRGKDAHEISQ